MLVLRTFHGSKAKIQSHRVIELGEVSLSNHSCDFANSSGVDATNIGRECNRYGRQSTAERGVYPWIQFPGNLRACQRHDAEHRVPSPDNGVTPDDRRTAFALLVSDGRITYWVRLEHDHSAPLEFNWHSCTTLNKALAIHPLNVDKFRLVEGTSPVVLWQRLQPRIETRIFVSFNGRSFRECVERKVRFAGSN